MCIEKNTYRHLVILIMKFLDEENFKESLQALKQESKIFFNINHFEQTIVNGEWEIADEYLSAFTKLDDNRYSRKLFFELRKQKYYDALCRNDQTEAVSIFLKDLKVFSVFPNIFVGELAELFDLKDLRENELLSRYKNTTSARAKLLDVLKILVKRSRVMQDKLVFTRVNKSALLSLISLICPSFEKENRSIKEELIYLILQFLDEEEFKETLHRLEQESKVFFNMNYFGEHVANGEWNKAEKYLSAFTKNNDNLYSAKMFSKMRRLALRHSKLPSKQPAKDYLQATIQVLAEKNPILQDKLNFPSMDKSRLLNIIKLMMDWWIPYSANIMPEANKQTISLKDIPTVPCIFHSFQEGGFLPSPSVDEVLNYKKDISNHFP
ncbi:Topless-related protein 4 [Melia azedarach]|uniref:Topless-related protein 4 n=1 Tax=Melia azedarach TaxID=155640 RepID=A0ACC1Y9K3_MELAZ|nr:Topless-related protein 4 [Melia azedarach]